MLARRRLDSHSDGQVLAFFAHAVIDHPDPQSSENLARSINRGPRSPVQPTLSKLIATSQRLEFNRLNAVQCEGGLWVTLDTNPDPRLFSGCNRYAQDSSKVLKLNVHGDIKRDGLNFGRSWLCVR